MHFYPIEHRIVSSLGSPCTRHCLHIICLGLFHIHTYLKSDSTTSTLASSKVFRQKREMLILEIIRMVARVNDCFIGIDTQSEDVTCRRIPKCCPQLVRYTIDQSLRLGCSVDHMSFSDQFPYKAEHFQYGGEFEAAQILISDVTRHRR